MRREFYERLGRKNTSPLWESMTRLIPPAPVPGAVPALWKYGEMRPLLMDAGGLITAKEAERRVLILENPGLRGIGHVAGSLYAGLQLVMPGEVTSTHRHVSTAMRFIVEGSGAYTTVEGQRVTMNPGDLILTPSWTWHDHGNPSAEPVVWMDGLDVPIVNLFDSSFMEHHAGEPVGAAEAPRFSYPYAEAREKLRAMSSGAIHASDGFRMRYPDPCPTMAAFLQLLPQGFRGVASRSTESKVFCVADGAGHTRVGSDVFEWTRGDIFVAPSWCPIAHEADGEAVLFSFTDRPAQQALGLWREG